MTAWAAFRDGIGRVNAAPFVLLVTLLVTQPLSLMLDEQIARHLGARVTGDGGAPADFDWQRELSAEATGLGATSTPSITGLSAVLQHWSRLADNEALSRRIVFATVAWLAVWTFVTGGIIDRYARYRPVRAHGFLAACGTHFWRLLRLGVLAVLAWLLLFGAVHGWLFESAYERLTGNGTAERTAFTVRLLGYTLFTALTAAGGVLFDYARVRIVVEDRRSATGAILAAARFMARHVRPVCALFFLNALALVVVIAACGALSPGPARADMHMWLILALGQIYIVARHYLKLLVYASDTALFQGILVHAGDTAARVPVWPESPAVETITKTETTSAR
jgi:hypothetical protein